MRLSVIGLGYVGATQAACLASFGHEVIAIDRDTHRVDRLAHARPAFHEPGLTDLLVAVTRSGLLTFDTDVSAAAGADAHLVCVGTPQRPDSNDADLSALWTVAETLGPLLAGPTVVIGKSTVPVGTATRLRQRLRSVAPAGDDVGVAWSPEFLREGHGIADTLTPDRLVFGVEDNWCFRVLETIYASQLAAGVPVVRTDLATAELAKVSANALLAARVSMVNLLDEMCAASAADVGALLRIVGLDRRIGADYLSPGIGFGGSCLPKDLRALEARGAELGVGPSLRLLREVDEVNVRQRRRMVDHAVALLADEPGPVAILGLAFKSGSDDVRDSPALAVAAELHRLGHRVRAYDPLSVPAARSVHPELSYAVDPEEVCDDAVLTLVLSDAPEITALDPAMLAKVVRSPRVLDGRMALDAATWTRSGWAVHSLGR